MGCTGCSTKTEDGLPKGCNNNGWCSTSGCGKNEVYDWLGDIAWNGDIYPIYEISFKNGARKGYYRNSKKLDLYPGDLVVVETSLGYDVGKISLSGELVKLQMKKNKVEENDEEVKSILRKAQQREIDLMSECRALEKETMLMARILARKLGLDMKLGDVEYQADGKKATFFYTADGRVDFRELIKVLAKEFKVKIEMRQIGARQEAGRVGGIGSCGRELCCSTWLSDFKSVNTSAARYQNLSINQTKLSGQCGRLKCCLNFELDSYLDALKAFPNHVDTLEIETGVARLMKTDVLKGLMFYQIDKTGAFYPLPVENVKMIKDLNKNGKKPAGLAELAVIDEKEEVIEYADLVGHISLKTLEKTSRKNNNNRNKSQQGNKPNTNNNNNPQPQNSARPQNNNKPKPHHPNNQRPNQQQQNPNKPKPDIPKK
jgi:cell fate regulator YaaT (PSP1 superfamily)